MNKKNILKLILVFQLLLLGKDAILYSQEDWLYPRKNLQNTASSQVLGLEMTESPTELWTFTSDSSLKTSLYPVAADINNDGKIEIIVGFWQLNTGGRKLNAFSCEDGSLVWNYDLEGSPKWAPPIITDINNDNQLDIVLGAGNKILAFKANDTSVIWNVPFSGAMGFTVGNLDDDNFLEVVCHSYNSREIFLLDGQDGATLWQSATSGSAYNIPAIYDIDGDGYNEILCHNHQYEPSRERLYCWDRNGNIKWIFDASPSDEQANNAPIELGYTPDFGYVSTSIADFNNDGYTEIGFGTRCHYYLLDRNGELIWKVPLVEGWGFFKSYNEDSSFYVDNHGTGGPQGYAAAIGDLDGDSIPEIALSLQPEFIGTCYTNSKWVYSKISPANKVIILNGENGNKLWEFEGEYSEQDSMESMIEPIMVDVDGDSLLDVLVYSSCGNMYAIKGKTGELIWKYSLPPTCEGYGNLTFAIGSLTFVKSKNQGILLFDYSAISDKNTYVFNLTALSLGTFKSSVETIANSKKIINYQLTQNYPNPFNSTTSINYTIGKPSIVEMNIYDINGELILPVFKKFHNQGNYTISVDFTNFHSGVYFYRLKSKNVNITKSLLLIK